MNNMPTIYDVINVLPFEAHNWFLNADPLKEIFKQMQIKTVIEVGSWFGGSTRWFAKQLPEDGYVIAVDTWKGSAEHQYGADCYHQKLDQLYQQFLANCVHEKIDHKIIPVRMDSLEAAAALKIQPDLFYLDAAHDETSVYKDLTTWGPKLKSTTLICGDDYNWPGVKAAVNRYAKEHGFRVVSAKPAPFWFFLPVGHKKEDKKDTLQESIRQKENELNLLKTQQSQLCELQREVSLADQVILKQIEHTTKMKENLAALMRQILGTDHQV